MKGTDSFTQARNFTAANRAPGDIRLWVNHDMEAPEDGDIAERLGSYFATTTRRASSHVGIDDDTVVGYVDWPSVAWAAPTANRDGVQIEHAGYARQSRAEWLDPYGTRMIELSARLFVEVGHGEFGLPNRWLTIAEVAGRVARGICDHHDTTRAFGIKGGHTDMGNHFPRDRYIARNDTLLRDPDAAPLEPLIADPVVHRFRYAHDPVVEEAQSHLVELGFDLEVDGFFGPETERVVLDFQSRGTDADGRPLAIDGIVGPKTLGVLRILVFLHRSAIVLPPAPAARPPIPPFPGIGGRYPHNGDYGNDVTKIQQRLKDRGWTIVVDGHFGIKTALVIEAFQNEKGLAIDGTVGPTTWQTMWTAEVT